jgi:hypothetical protein
MCFTLTISSSPPLLGFIIQRIPSLLYYALLSGILCIIKPSRGGEDKMVRIKHILEERGGFSV